MTDWLTVEVGERAVEVVVTGATDGVPLVFHHGTPAAATELAQLHGPGARVRPAHHLPVAAGLRGSTPRPGRSVADVVDDVVAVLDALGVDHFLTLGWSGGGPHALACAALLPDRCPAAATLAGVAPREAAGLDWSSGMADENLAEFGAAETSERGPHGVPGGHGRRPRRRHRRRSSPTRSAGWCPTSTARPCTATSPTRWPSRSGGRSRPASRAGATTTSPSCAPGASTWRRSASRSRSGRAAATAWCRSRTGSGSPRTCRAPAARLEPGEGHLSLIPALARILVDLRALAGV